MKRRWLSYVAISVLGAVLGSWPHVAIGQQAAPTDNKGVKVIKTTAVDLGPEIEGMQGRQLRMRLVTLEPGGHVAVHGHKDRPGMAYVLQGTLTDHRGGATNQYRAGDAWPENKDTTHWIQNNGTEPVTLIAVDIIKTQ